MTDDPGRQSYLAFLMRKAIADYEQRRRSVTQLAEDLESCIASLAEVSDPDWARELHSEWWRIEVVAALLLDEGRAEPTDDERQGVEESLSALGAALAAY